MSSEETLVVGRDTTTRALLCSAFARQGLRARAALDGIAALELCRQRPPSALVIEPNADGVSLPDFVAALRSNVRLRRIAIVLLGVEPSTDPTQRIASLPLPVYGNDVVSLARFLSADTSQGLLPLGDYNVLSFVRALYAARVEAHLIFRRPLPTKIPEAHVSLSSEGIFCRAGHLVARPALNRVAVWRRAQVVWRLGPPPETIEAEQIDEAAFGEAAQYLAEVRALLSTLPTDELPLRLINEKRPPASKVPGEVNTILNLCSEGRSLDSILEDVPFRVLDSLRIIRRLFDLGVLAKPAPLSQPSYHGETGEGEEPVQARPIVVLAGQPGEPEEPPMPSRSTWPVPAPEATSVLQELEERVARTLEEDGDELDEKPPISSFEEFSAPHSQLEDTAYTERTPVPDEPVLHLEQEYGSDPHTLHGDTQEEPYPDTPVQTPASPRTRRWKLGKKQ